MNEGLVKANIYKVIRAAGMAGGSVVAVTGGAVTGAEWSSWVGAATAVISFGFSIYDSFVVDGKLSTALWTAPTGYTLQPTSVAAPPPPASVVQDLGVKT